MIDLLPKASACGVNLAAPETQDQLDLITYIGKAQFRCTHCGITSAPTADALHGFMEIHVQDDKHECLCPICHAGLHIHCHVKRREVVLIVAPWIEQKQLNRHMWVILGAGGNNDDHLFNDANTVYDEFFRSQKSIPGIFEFFPGNEAHQEDNLVLMLDAIISQGYEEKFKKQLRDVRYIPHFSFKKKAVEHIYNVILGENPPPIKWNNPAK